MSKFEVGDWVVCTIAITESIGGPSRGRIYQVMSVETPGGYIGIQVPTYKGLADIGYDSIRNGVQPNFVAAAFRKITPSKLIRILCET